MARKRPSRKQPATPRREPGQRKRRTREHVVADLAVNHFERQALLCGFAVERSANDYGIDLRLLTFNARGEVQPGFVLVQMKGTDKIRFLRDRSAVTWRIERGDLVVWGLEILPVILVVYDTRGDAAYWLHVQSYLAGRPKGAVFQEEDRITIRLPATQVLNSAAIRQFAAILQQVGAANSEGS